MKTKTLVTALALAFAGGVYIPDAQAEFILLDNMNYGTVDSGASVGDWVDGSNRLNYRAGTNLTFGGDPDYVNDANNLANNGSLERNDNQDDRFYRRQFSDGTLTGEFWMSTLVQISSPNASFSGFVGVSLNENDSLTLSGDLVGIDTPSDGTYEPMWRDLSSTTSTKDAGNAVAVDTTYLLLTKLTIGPGADSFSMWLFDAADSFGQTEASLGSAILSSASADFGDALDWIQVGGSGGGAAANFDQLRISDRSGDAGLVEVLTATIVPEPASLALLSLGGLLLAGRNRR